MAPILPFTMTAAVRQTEAAIASFCSTSRICIPSRPGVTSTLHRRSTMTGAKPSEGSTLRHIWLSNARFPNLAPGTNAPRFVAGREHVAGRLIGTSPNRTTSAALAGSSFSHGDYVGNQQRSLEAFLAAKAEFDAMAAKLKAMSAEHFGANPEAVLWGMQRTWPTGPDGCAR
ncbi:hypothetical protein [Elioraea rosea]|uniref:hypothetical protein n=1 Tax=Elioraea rosea TaxID=2492390 RepID=UPI0011842425|nr:hypothetical protein [Elioraea rosea]